MTTNNKRRNWSLFAQINLIHSCCWCFNKFMQSHRYKGKWRWSLLVMERREVCDTKSTKFFFLHRRKLKYLHINVYFSTSIFSMCLVCLLSVYLLFNVFLSVTLHFLCKIFANKHNKIKGTKTMTKAALMSSLCWLLQLFVIHILVGWSRLWKCRWLLSFSSEWYKRLYYKDTKDTKSCIFLLIFNKVESILRIQLKLSSIIFQVISSTEYQIFTDLHFLWL